MIHQINKMKDKNHMNVSIGPEKEFDKILYSFMIKTASKVETKRTYLSTVKATYDTSTANIILNGEKLKGISLRPRT